MVILVIIVGQKFDNNRITMGYQWTIWNEINHAVLCRNKHILTLCGLLLRITTLIKDDIYCRHVDFWVDPTLSWMHPHNQRWQSKARFSGRTVPLQMDIHVQTDINGRLSIATIWLGEGISYSRDGNTGLEDWHLEMPIFAWETHLSTGAK